MCADIPWFGPVGACRVAMIDGSLVVHPPTQSLSDTQMSVLVAGTRDRVVMFEAEGQAVRRERNKHLLVVCLSGWLFRCRWIKCPRRWIWHTPSVGR